MGLSIRTLLIWLLVLALPVQGATAVTMASCGPNHASSATAASLVLAASSSHSHDGDMAQAAHGHDGAGVEAATALDTSAPATGGHADAHKCSACASCCSSSAMLASALQMPFTDIAATAFATVVVSVDAFAVGGPDRPPRPVLA